MPGRLANKNVLITGAAGGVGLETTILMLREGASVLMTDVSAPAPPRSPTRPHGRAWTPSSSTWPSRPTSRARSTGSRRGAAWGGVDAVFNNAGIMDPGDGDDASDEVWARTLAVNVKGVWYGSKHAVRGMREAGKRKGSVVNTASVVALVGSATAQVAYTASKGAVLALTRELAVVHARGKDFLGDDKEKRFRREVHSPTGRFGEAIEQAHAAVFLASDESSFVNGTDFVVDGGMTKAYVTPEGPPTAAPRNMTA
ncbi:hypothetical protein GTA08_BOTSDO03159 [Botryosphaeria dothidea]|uniref:Short-chain dehydrogenase reductase family protein n=1 Tax=Botryosphaeria dothidea TaxID=55169 RepID=A0A8H4N308_9PEZI|nr:hypothetical protein GTA08_BOTSDO03159 [Botryosphaeria dothidea]